MSDETPETNRHSERAIVPSEEAVPRVRVDDRYREFSEAQLKLVHIMGHIQNKMQTYTAIKELYSSYDTYVCSFGYSCNIGSQGTEIPPEHRRTLDGMEQALKFLVPTLPELGIEKELLTYFRVFRTGRFRSKEKNFLKLRRRVHAKLDNCVKKINRLPLFKRVVLHCHDFYKDFGEFLDYNIEAVGKVQELKNKLDRLMKGKE